MGIDESIKTSNSVFCKSINQIMSDPNVKSGIIRSRMGTGKTQLLNKLFNEYPEQMKRVLFISCRQSLANEFESVFAQYEIANYMSGEYLNKRMVCSIESINNMIESYENDESIYLFI